MKKKTPKSSKKRAKAKGSQENIIILIIFLIFIAAVAYLFYFVNIKTTNDDVVATVNGNEITRDELDWWYKTSILPEYRGSISKQDFLVMSLIPQEVLVHKAKEEGIKVTEEEVEKLLGLFVIEGGFTLIEFEVYLNSRGITIDQIKKSFEIRAIITKLLEKENIDFIESENLLFTGADVTFQEYLNDLIDNSEIEIFLENIEKIVLKSFEATNDEVCGEGKPIVRLYTKSGCQICDEGSEIFENLVEDERIDVAHWSLDTGDNLLTPEKERGVPKKEVDMFKKYSPNKLVPTVVLDCKYKHIGKFGFEEEDELKTLLQELIGS